MGSRCGKVAGSIHINSAAVCFFLIFEFSAFRFFIFSFFSLSYFYMSYSYIHISTYSHIPMFSKNAALMNSMHSVRKMVHNTEGVWSEPGIFELNTCWQAWLERVAGTEGVAGSWIRFRSTQMCFFLFLFSYFLIFLLSYCLILLFSSFHLSSYHRYIFRICLGAYSHIHIFIYSHVFKKCSAHKQYAFCQEDIS
jgi:hypothetical protein